MGKIKITLSFILIFAMILNINIFAADTISLKDAIEMTLNNSTEIINQNNKLEDLKSQKGIMYSDSASAANYLDTYNQFLYLKSKEILTLEEIFELKFLNYLFAEPMKNEEKYQLSVSAELGMDNYNYMLTTNEIYLQNLKNNIVMSISNEFNNMDKINQEISIKKKLIVDMEKNYNAAQARFKLGKISQNSLTQVKISLDKEKINLNKALNQREIEIYKIHKAIGRDMTKKYGDYSNSPIESVKPDTLEKYIDTALHTRLDIQNARLYVTIQEKQLKIAQKVFNDTPQAINLDEAKNSLEEAQNNLEALDIDIRIQVTNEYNSLIKLVNALKNAEDTLSANKKNYEAMYKKYSLGTITELELQNEDMKLAQSEINFSNTSRDLVMAKMRLDSIIGYNLYQN